MSETEFNSLSDFAPIVSDTLNSRSSRAERQQITDVISDWLEENERLLLETSQRDQPEAYLIDDDGSVLRIDPHNVYVQAAFNRAGFNATERAFKWLIAGLRSRALNAGEKVTLNRWQHRDGDTLYISCGRKAIVIAEPHLEGDGVLLDVVPNGTDGVLFAAEATYPEWQIVDAVDPFELAALQPTLEAPTEIAAYSPLVQQLLFEAFLIGLISDVRPLPLVVLLGGRGSGKTTAARAVCRLLLDAEGDVSDPNLKEGDFAAAVTNLPVFVIDNLDGAPPKWLPDALAHAVTSGTIHRRKLYEDNRLIRHEVESAIMVTTRTAQFAQRADNLERVVPLFIGDLLGRDRVSHRELISELQLARNGVLRWLADEATRAHLAMKQVSIELPGRFQDFAAIVWYLCEHTEQYEALNTHEVLDVLERAQVLSITDLPPLVYALVEYVSSTGKLKSNASGIVKTLEEAGAALPHYGGGKQISRELDEAKPLLARFDISVVVDRSTPGKPVFTITHSPDETVSLPSARGQLHGVPQDKEVALIDDQQRDEDVAD